MSPVFDLSRLLRPRSVAVFGGGWGASVVEQLCKAGFAGDIWPVHPVRDTVSGVRAYPSLDALPHAPDAAWIGVNRDATIDIVGALATGGAGGAVCFASGFGETEDGGARNTALLAAAGDMPIIGPNCYGLINYLDGAVLWPDQHGGRRIDGAITGEVAADSSSGIATGQGRGVAILTQSSNIAINLTMQRRGLPIAYMMTAGNQAQIGLADMARALLEDDRVTAIGLHVEGVGDPAAFEVLAQAARERRVPIVALKVGTSAQAQAATVSHTASLAGSEAGSRAFFARLGIPLVATLPEMVETLKLLHVHGPLTGRSLLSMSCSGGEASLVADMAAARDLDFPPYTTARRAAVAATLNPMVTVANPLDYHTFSWGDEGAMAETFAAAMVPGDAGRFDLSMLILDFPRTDRCSDGSWTPAVAAITTAARRVGRPVAVVATLGELLPEDRCDAFIAAGIAPLCGIAEALAAADAAAALGEGWERRAPSPILNPVPTLAPLATLGEGEAKAMLADFGIPVPEGRHAATVARARDAAAALGYPVVLKTTGLAHKTEAGGVRLNLSDRDAVGQAAADLLRAGDGVLVERMVTDGVAEMIVGISRDPVYGLMLTIGAGGVLAELLTDTATLLLPTTAEEVAQALAGLKIARLLAGWRGGPAADIDAAVTAILGVARFAQAHGSMLEELDINPLILCENDAWAADALIRTRAIR